MSKTLNNVELIQKLETAEKRIIQLEDDLARKARLLDEYERAEHECQEREQKLNQLLEILPVGISILDAEHNIVYSNPALQKILQINQEGLLNGSYRDRRYVTSNGAPMPPDGFASRQAKQSGKPVYDVETGILKEEGNTIWTSVSATPVDFSDWKIVITTTDITSRKNAEEEQRRSQDRLSKIFQTSPVPMVIGDVETNQFMEVNQAYERLVGYDRHEIVGHTPFELDIYPNKEQLIRARNEVQTQGGLHGAELTLRTKSNELRDILAWSQLLRLSNGQMIILGTALDMTGHRLIEQSLRENEARYRSLFENLPVAIWEEDFSAVKAYLDDLEHQGVTDLDAYLTSHEEAIRACVELTHVTDVNQASVSMNRAFSKADLLGSLGNRFPEEALAGFKNELLRVAKGELSFHAESCVRTFDGQLRQVIIDWTVPPGYEQTYEKVLVTLSDITDLREAQEKYQELFENSPEGIFQTTPDGHFLNANPALARIYGYDSAQELTESVTDISHQLYLNPEDRHQFTELLQSEDHITNFEMQNFRKDGTIVWTCTSARAVRDGNGNILWYDGFLQDITERKQAQQALADNEKRFRAMIENGLDDISLLDAGGHLLWERPAVVRNLGYAPNEHLGHNIFDLIHPEDRGWTNQLFTKLIHEPGSRQSGTFRLHHADGSWRWVEAVAANLLDEPSVAGVVINYRDITERKAAEEARHEAEVRYRALFEQSHDAIFILDLEGRHLAFNQRAADMLGYSREELLRLSVTEISAEQTQSQQVLRDLLHGRHIPIYERLFRKKDGSTFPVEINAELVRDVQGNPLHIQSVVREITDRRRAEIELQQRNEDLGVINAINEIIVQGGKLDLVVSVLANEMKRIFSSQGTSLYMLTPDRHSLTMQQYAMPTELTRKIEQLIGSTIPIVKIPIQEGGLFERVLHSGRGIIVNDPKELQHWLTGFAETEFLPSIARGAIRKLLPQIQKLLNIKSTIIIPLRSHENTIGLLNVSSTGLFADEDLKRIESIGVQLTAAIQHQQANEKIQRSEEFLNSIQNALSASIVILDETGTIVQANSAWRKFGEQNGLADPRASIGRNYLDICDSASGANAEEAPVVARAIRDVIAGRRKEARVEYPCHSPQEQRWFLLRITRFKDGDKIWVMLAHENITERRQAQEALQWSESLLAQAGKMAHLGAWEIVVSARENLNKNPLLWSDEVYRIFGYEPREVEVTNDLFFSHVHPDDRPQVQWAIEQAIAERKQYAVEHRIIRADGVERIVEERADLIFNAQGQLTQILGAIQDVTERKRTEQALRETSEQFRALFEASPEAIMLVDPQGDWPILDCNATACSMNGYVRQELIGQSIDILTLSPGDAAGRLEYLEKVRSAGILRFEDFHRHKDGNIFPIDIATSLITVGGREIVLGIDRDITERKIAEAALRESEEKYRLLFEANPMPMWIFDLETLRFLKVNTAAINHYGYSEIEFMSMTIKDIRPPKDVSRLLENIAQVKSGLDSAGVWTHLKKDGSPIQVEIMSHQVDFDGRQAKLVLVSDLTERIRAEAALHESEQKYRNLVETSHDLIWSVDGDGLFTYLNQASKEIYGYEPEELLGHSFLEILDPASYTLDWDTFKKNIPDRDKFVDVESVVRHRDGRQIILSANSLVLRDGNNNLIGIVGSSRDITERKRAEEALRESEERFSNAFEFAPIGMALVALEGRWLKVNQAICELVGYAREELQGMTFQQITHPDDLEADLNQVKQLLAGAIDSYQMEKRYIHKSGRFVWVLLGVSLIKDLQGGPSYFISQIQDITERKQAEEDLRRSETRYRLATQATNDVIWEWDALAHQLLWSENAQVVFGYSAEEIGPEEKWWDQHIHPDDLERILSKLDDFMSSPGSIWSEEYRFLRKNGSYACVSDRAYMERDPEGTPLRMIGAMSDITEQKKNEDETRRRADEFAVLYETARDLATQSHLPTLLNTIVQRARALLRAYGGGIYLYDEARDDLEMVLAVGSPIPTGIRVQMGEGMAGRVAQTQQRLIVDDYHAWAGRSSQIGFESIPFRAVLEVPMLYGGKLIGVLVVHELGEAERKYTEADAHLLSLFAEYAASAVHAARLLQQTTRRAEETAALLETSLALTSLDLDSTLQTFGEHAQRLFESDGCRIFLMEPDGETLRCVLALQETPEAFSHLRIKLGVGVTGTVAASGRAEIVNEMQNDPRALQIANTPDEEEAIMFAPLKARDRTIGVLSVRRVGTQRPFQPADLSLLEALASMSASAVSNARLFEQTEQRLNELQALYENGLAVGRLLEPNAIGERIIQTVSQYLSWHHVTIRLCKENSDELELVAFHLPHVAEEKTTEDEQRFKFHVGRVGQGLSGWVVQTGDPIRTSNLSQEPHYVNTYEGMQSGLYMPLKVGDRVIGVISVESEEPDAFSEQDERLLATLANQAATAFENARLYQSAQQEIRERSIAEEALRQSEENYRGLARQLEDRVYERTAEVQDLYDNAPCGYLSLNPDGKIVRINQTELDWLGYRREEILGCPFTDFVTYESQNIFKETFPAFKQQGSIRDLELEILRKDGSVLPILVSATAVYDQDGKYLTSRSTLSDDTSRKHAMETLRLANAEMKRAMRMKDEFLANMSHELRTPLNAILGLSESLLEQTAGPINEKQQKYLGTVNESGRHLLELINDILDLAKIESGQIKIDPGRVNINAVCEASLRMIKQLAQKKNQTVEVEIEKEIGYVWADERRLKQMMVNLLSNAVKFTPVDGQLGLKASIDRHDMKLLIIIWDHGIGIREEDLSRLFRPFVQLDSSLARESSGTGLGLALVAEMARLHGGSVSVVSQPGKGSEFTISLPWDPAITTDTLDKLRISGKIPLMKRTSTEKQTILLVEDTDSVVLMLRDYLELSGYKVEIARDGLQGLSKAISVRPDLILMDVQMPGLDGLEATRRIRRDDSLKSTPIIALTALAMPSDRTRCLEAGMNDYLSKPINLKELAKAVLRNLPDSGTG